MLSLGGGSLRELIIWLKTCGCKFYPTLVSKNGSAKLARLWREWEKFLSIKIGQLSPILIVLCHRLIFFELKMLQFFPRLGMAFLVNESTLPTHGLHILKLNNEHKHFTVVIPLSLFLSFSLSLSFFLSFFLSIPIQLHTFYVCSWNFPPPTNTTTAIDGKHTWGLSILLTFLFLSLSRYPPISSVCYVALAIC